MASSIAQLDRVVLTEDLSQHGLKAGDVGTVVHVAGEGRGYIVEFMTLSGETFAVSPVNAGQVRRADRAEVPHARRLAG